MRLSDEHAHTPHFALAGLRSLGVEHGPRHVQALVLQPKESERVGLVSAQVGGRQRCVGCVCELFRKRDDAAQ